MTKTDRIRNRKSGQFCRGFPGWLSGKESAYQCRRCSSTPGSGRSPGEGNGNPLQSQTEEPSGLWGHKRVGRDLATK